MGVTLERVQNKFACIIGELCSEPDILSQFAVWVDLRIAEYKAKGAISLDCTGTTPNPKWLKGLRPSKPSRPDPLVHRGPAVMSSRNARHKKKPSIAGQNSNFETTVNTEWESGDSGEVNMLLVKEEAGEHGDQDGVAFPVSLHSNQTSQSRKRLAAEEQDVLLSDNSIFPTAPSPKERRTALASDNSSSVVAQDSVSNQSFLSVIGVTDQPSLSPEQPADTSVNVIMGENDTNMGDNSGDISFDNSQVIYQAADQAAALTDSSGITLRSRTRGNRATWTVAHSSPRRTRKSAVRSKRNRYLERLRQDPTRYDVYRQQASERARLYRASMSEEEKAAVKERSRLRMRRYRERQKQEMLAAEEFTVCTGPSTITTERFDDPFRAQRLRDYWRTQKRVQRAAQSQQERDHINEQRRKQYRESENVRVLGLEEEASMCAVQPSVELMPDCLVAGYLYQQDVKPSIEPMPASLGAGDQQDIKPIVFSPVFKPS